MSYLTKMMDMQNDFQESLGQDINGMSTEERTAFIKEHSIHATQEMHEMLYELPFFKPWKDYSEMDTVEIAEAYNNARKEFIDMWHFMLNIALALGFTSDDIYDEYVDKNNQNYERQKAGYTHDVSYRE